MTGIKILFGEVPSVRAAYTGQFVKVAAGGGHSCGIRSDGVVECWGNNTDHEAPATRTATVGTSVDLTTSATHTCATRSYPNQDAAECWGNNVAGQAPASKPGAFQSISGGGLHTCGTLVVLDATHFVPPALTCWGDNHLGQAPTTRTPAPGAGNSFKTVSAGGDHTCGSTKVRFSNARATIPTAKLPQRGIEGSRNGTKA